MRVGNTADGVCPSVDVFCLRMYLWCLLAALRIALVFLPQTGYIHPDEFFQSTEIAAGDVFDLRTYRAWEFTDENPVRSAAIVHFLAGVPLVALKLLLHRPPSPYLLLVVPRLFVCLLSFVCDYAAHRASRGRRGAKRGAVLVASSYVALVYYGRTLGNSAESFLLASLFLTIRDGCDVRSVSAILTVGIFNRPTFAVFAFPSVVRWIFRRGGVAQSLRRAFLLSRWCAVFAAGLVSFDTLYYAPFDALPNLPTGGLRIVVSPLNFVRYNLNVSNLASHGLHPRWLHLVVNFPVLFNVAGVVSLWASVRIVRDSLLRRDFTGTHAICASTIVFSVCFFSLFPHQEPRFLVPLLVPVVVLSHGRVASSVPLLTAWVVCNVLCTLFFGFVHHGGVVPCLLRLRSTLNVEACRPSRVVFWRTYMPPRHLLAIPKTCGDVAVVDLAGGSLASLTDGTILVTPSAEEPSLGGVRLRRLFRCFPHFGGDRPPDPDALLGWFGKADFGTALQSLADKMTLDVFEVLDLGKNSAA